MRGLRAGGGTGVRARCVRWRWVRREGSRPRCRGAGSPEGGWRGRSFSGREVCSGISSAKRAGFLCWGAETWRGDASMKCEKGRRGFLQPRSLPVGPGGVGSQLPKKCSLGTETVPEHRLRRACLCRLLMLGSLILNFKENYFKANNSYLKRKKKLMSSGVAKDWMPSIWNLTRERFSPSLE